MKYIVTAKCELKRLLLTCISQTGHTAISIAIISVLIFPFSFSVKAKWICHLYLQNPIGLSNNSNIIHPK